MSDSFRDLIVWQKAMKEFVQMLARARGSSFEVQTQLEISKNVGYLATDMYADLDGKTAEVGRLLSGLINSLRRDIDAAATPGSPKS